MYKEGEPKFCECTNGLIGDYCDVFSDCGPGAKTDCGEIAICSYDEINKEVFCKCPVDEMGYDNTTKTCKSEYDFIKFYIRDLIKF